MPLDPRAWQLDCLGLLRSRPSGDFLICACPAAGKTYVALADAARRLAEGTIDYIIIMVPTDRLREQWKEEAHKFGIELGSDLEDVRWDPNMHGCVISYQTLARGNNADRVAGEVSRHRSMVIFDELHHAGTQLPWGSALKVAFTPAVFRLALSGTPWRTDAGAIPFVTYDAKGNVVPDFPYTYADAINDRDPDGDSVCRQYVFPCIGGNVKYFFAGKENDLNFSDEVNEDEANRRLRTALLKGDFCETQLRAAWVLLCGLREEQPDVGMIILAIDQQHARMLARLVEQITGRPPVVATSDDANAQHKIKAFASGREPVLIAVRMASEGVDIPRARILVWLTVTLTELFFAQAIGRVGRTQKGLADNTAYVLLPADKRLMRYSQKIKDAVNHQLQLDLDRISSGPDADVDRERPPSTFTPLDSRAEPAGSIFDATHFTPEILEHCAKIGGEAGSRDDPAVIARMFQLEGLLPRFVGTSPGPEPTSPHLEQRKKTLKRANKDVVAKIVRSQMMRHGLGREHQQSLFEKVGGELNRKVGIDSTTRATEAELQRRLELAHEILEQEQQWF